MKYFLRGFYICLLMLFVACGKDDYHYPSVCFEFLTAMTGEEGRIERVQTDEGECLPVWEDVSGVKLKKGDCLRIISNYEHLHVDGKEGVKLYAVSKAIAPLPKPASEFKEGIHTEAASVNSIWMGYDYLNMVLEVKQQGKHILHFIEDEVTKPDTNGQISVKITLYHAVDSQISDYAKRAYVSLPLRSYVKEGVSKVKVEFSLHTDAVTDEPYIEPDVETGALKTYYFEYIPR